MEYRGIWIFFCVLWFLLGAAVAGYPVRVARLLGRKGDLPPSRFLTALRMIGVVVAIGALAKAVFRSGESMSDMKAGLSFLVIALSPAMGSSGGRK